MSENELAVPEGGELAVAGPDALAELLGASESRFANEKSLAEVTKVGDWIPFVQLMGSNSTEVKQGKFPMGHFCLRQNRQLVDLGSSFVALFLAWRPKAMWFSTPPVSVFDTEHEKFKEFEKMADTKGVQGYGYGQEFLAWIPDRKLFVTYFLGNKTGRNESPNITALINTQKYVCEQRAELIDDGTNQWHGARTYEYDLEVEFPPADQLTAQLEKFNNPEPIIEPKSETEGSTEAAEGDDARR